MNVTIRIIGVREENLSRLRTAIKTHLVRFGNSLTVDDGSSDDAAPKKDESSQRRGRATR